MTLYFSSFPPPRSRPRPRPPLPRWLLLLRSKPFQLDLRYLGQRKYSSWKMYWITGCDIDKQKFAYLQDEVRTTKKITTKLGSYIRLVMVIICLDFGGILLETLSCQKFGCVFSRSNTLLNISQEWLVRLMWNEKEVHRLDTGWNMWPWPLS